MQQYILSFIVLFCLVGHVGFGQTDSVQEVFVCEEDIAVPPGSKLIDKIKVVDGGFKLNCGHDLVLEQAKEKVQKKGGNILKITRWKEPSAFGSTCYQLWGEAYYVDNLAEAIVRVSVPPDTASSKLLDANASYALLCVYRPKAFQGSVINYKVHADDRELFRVNNGECDTFRLYKEGVTNIWAKTEARSELSLDVKFGTAYFLRCGVEVGVMVGRPKLAIVVPNKGYKEYMAVLNK